MGISWSATPTPTPKHLQRSAKTKSVLFTYEDYTSDAPDDEKIRRSVAGLQVAIINHARDYYHENPIQQSPEEIEESLTSKSEDFPRLTDIEVAHLLCNKRSRRSAITFLISNFVTENIRFNGSKTYTLLSPYIVGCVKEFGFGDSDGKLTEEDEMAFTQWRFLTSHLLAEPEVGEGDMRVEKLAKILDNILVKFHDPEMDNNERLRCLKGIVAKGAVVGRMIFESPSRWNFDWNPSRKELRARERRSNRYSQQPAREYALSDDGRTIVLVRFPALVQRCTENIDGHPKLRKRREPGDYDTSTATIEILKKLRQVDKFGSVIEDNVAEPAPSIADQSQLSTSSPSKSTNHHSKHGIDRGKGKA